MMAPRPNIRIARKARSKAESDFATWLMMAKLGSFDDLPANAQGFLTDYRTRLERMSDAESKVVAVREVYAAYYSEMGGAGAAPEPAPNTPVDDSVARSQRSRKPRPAPPAAGASARSAALKSVTALLIFAVMVALIAAYKFLAE